MATSERIELAHSLLGQSVRFRHMPDMEPAKVTEATSDGMIEIERFSGEFCPTLFTVADQAQPDTYPQPEHGWTCFHCGETFTTPGGARTHFGGNIYDEPGCLIRVQVGDERGWLMQIRKLEDEVRELREANEQMDHEAGSYHAQIAELERLFDGSRSVHQAWLKLEAMEGRALAAEEALIAGARGS